MNKFRSIILLSLSVLLMFISLSTVFAGVTETTADFESGTLPQGWETFVGWSGDTSTIVESPDPVHSGSRSLQQSASSSPTGAGGSFLTAIPPETSVSGAKYELEGWYYSTETQPGMTATQIYFNFPSGHTLGFQTSDYYYGIVNGSSSWLGWDKGASKFEWHNFKLTYDKENNTFDVMLDGAYLVQGLAATIEPQTPISAYVSTRSYGSRMTSYVDDISFRVYTNEPPVIDINSPEAKKYQHFGEIVPDVTVTDPDSDVETVVYKLDGTVINQGTNIGLLDLSLGNHNFEVKATDSAGNVTTKAVKFSVIASIESLISAKHELADRGDIDNQGIVNSLDTKLDAAAAALARGQKDVAVNNLEAFINELKAQSGKHVTESAANLLITDANYVIGRLMLSDNYALSFDGVDDYINAGNNINSSLQGGNKLTVSLWAKRSADLNRYAGIINIFHETGYKRMFGILSYDSAYDTNGNNKAYFTVWTENGFYNTPPTEVMPLNEWIQLTLVYDGSTLIGYVNGQETVRTAASGNLQVTDEPLLIGKYDNRFLPDEKFLFNGDLDDVRIWNKALTREEIQSNMYREIAPQEGLVGYWKFNEGSGDIAHDSSGNGNHGTLVNGPSWIADQDVFSFEGNWASVRGAKLYNGKAKYSARKGATALLKFKKARHLKLIVTKRPNGGYADIFIGRTKIKTISLTSSSTKYRQVISIKKFNKPTSGVLKIVVKPNKSSKSRVEIDGIVIKS